ncbi:DNA-processing protein DprA [Psychromonas sp. psych-6C06]|uniref:DNA-processing protein DprA n=1 Tax=Psychromonas sp. psych-6C06 TaxID=2058089 RepID=UPI001EE75A61|nr:DNA-processing protein DprA [Psychromonas sp. psych-6C06]
MARKVSIQQNLFDLDDILPTTTEQIKRWMVLDAIPALQKRTIFKLLTKHSLHELLTLPVATLKSYRLKETQINALLHPNLIQIEENLSWIDIDQQRDIICFDDSRYPARLKEISNPPLLLYIQGDSQLLATPQIALVGSRNCTPYGQEKAYQFARDLVDSGLTVTSGLALGIDGYSHQGALDAGGKTIAVLGTGLNNIYPKRHLKLAGQIIEHGLLVSEFWPNSPAIPSHFPRRNRIISGLSLGVLVVEASQRSGSLITARYASEQNREIFALPGSIDNSQACGCHHLIQQGAKLVVNISDITEEICYLSTVSCLDKESATNIQEEQHPLIQFIDFHLTTLEQILERSGIDLINVQNQLIELEITGRIKVTADGYTRC